VHANGRNRKSLASGNVVTKCVDRIEIPRGQVGDEHKLEWVASIARLYSRLQIWYHKILLQLLAQRLPIAKMADNLHAEFIALIQIWYYSS